MIFKSETIKTTINREKNIKKRGGQLGHKGHIRLKPKQTDQEKEVYLSHCPNCKNELKQTNRTYEKIVEDIVLIKKTIITKYIIQKQYCKH